MATTAISATGRSTDPGRASERGFSLLELLVVVAIIAVFVGATVLSVGLADDDRATRRQAARLKGVLDLAHEEALMQSQDLGVFFSASGYRFYFYDYDQQAWRTPAEDNLLVEHALDERLTLALLVEDREVVLENRFETDDRAAPKPQVMLFASGEVTPFEARISSGLTPGEYVLTAAANGAIEISTRGNGDR